MRVEEFFSVVKRIESLTQEADALKRKIISSKCEMDIDKARLLMENCRVAFPKEKEARESFVFLFVLMYGAPLDMKVPHKVADILGIILKKHRTSICRDFRYAKERAMRDADYCEALDELMI